MEGGHSRVPRCKTHLDTALAGVETVDSPPPYLFSSFVAFGNKRHANIDTGPVKPLVKAYQNVRGAAWKRETAGKRISHIWCSNYCCCRLSFLRTCPTEQPDSLLFNFY